MILIVCDSSVINALTNRVRMVSPHTAGSMPACDGFTHRVRMVSPHTAGNRPACDGFTRRMRVASPHTAGSSPAYDELTRRVRVGYPPCACAYTRLLVRNTLWADNVHDSHGLQSLAHAVSKTSACRGTRQKRVLHAVRGAKCFQCDLVFVLR